MTRSFTATHFTFPWEHRTYSRTCFDDKVTSSKKHGKVLLVKQGKSYRKCADCGAHAPRYHDECDNLKRGSSHRGHTYAVRIDDD